MARRVCTECGVLLTGGTRQKTCSTKCRGARSRRIKRARRDAGRASEQLTDEQRIVHEATQQEAKDLAYQLTKEELRPIVREALTEDVLRALDNMIALTPRVVECITEDLHSDDATIRQRAYTLVTKYTIGHPAVVTKEEDTAGKQMVVNFNLPRPGAEEIADAQVVEVGEHRECDRCHGSYPPDQFVAGSDRCQSCWDEMRAEVQARFGG